MSGDGDSRGKSAREVLDAWREQQADRLDPVRFRFIEVLESRAQGHGGEVRRILDEKLSKLLTSYAGALKKKPSSGGNVDDAKQPREATSGALGDLLKHIGGHRAPMAVDSGAAATESAEGGANDPGPSFSTELPALLEFRKIWSKVRTDGQLKQSLEQVPTNAGPLNSGVLVHRSIILMRELSPEYLQHFVSYADTLSWMEQMQGDGVLATDVSRAAGSSKQVRNKPRKRRT
ncbi:DUF2894 domain-containing protein [Pseudoxanthomonas sp. UTMC 1351]|uniref:DUF2894 domain-containing protein n=1 Tax=Pseudoxanthomonas sp. UTMC 1351 TaxID=2695853 RepID=UPI0034CEEADC